MACAPSEDSDQPAHQTSLTAWRCFGSLVALRVPCKSSDQTARMRRTIRVYARRTDSLVVNAVPWLIYENQPVICNVCSVKSSFISYKLQCKIMYHMMFAKGRIISASAIPRSPIRDFNVCSKSKEFGPIGSKFFSFREDSFLERSRCAESKHEVRKVISLVKNGEKKVPGVSFQLIWYIL